MEKTKKQIELGKLQAASLSDEATRTPPPHRSRDASTLSGWAGPVVLTYLLVGTTVFSVAEGWSPRDALYFCVTALTTVGYGDLVPKSDAGKLFCCVYVVSGVSLSSACLGVVLGRMQARVISTRLFSALGSSASSASQGRPHVTSIMHSAAGLAALVLSGAVFAHLSEGWSALDSVYWSIITCTSVGLGDRVISSEARTAGMCYMVVAVVGFFSLSGGVVRAFAQLEVERHVEAFVRDGITTGMIEEMDVSGSGTVDRAEFLSLFLVRTGKVEQAEVLKLNAMFSALDADASGRIDVGVLASRTEPAREWLEKGPPRARPVSLPGGFERAQVGCGGPPATCRLRAKFRLRAQAAGLSCGLKLTARLAHTLRVIHYSRNGLMRTSPPCGGARGARGARGAPL